MIPCFECICLAICKSKDYIDCTLLYTHMNDRIEYKSSQGMGLKKGGEVWSEVKSLFEKYDDQVLIGADIEPGVYAVGPKDLEACKRKQKLEGFVE